MRLPTGFWNFEGKNKRYVNSARVKNKLTYSRYFPRTTYQNPEDTTKNRLLYKNRIFHFRSSKIKSFVLKSVCAQLYSSYVVNKVVGLAFYTFINWYFTIFMSSMRDFEQRCFRHSFWTLRSNRSVWTIGRVYYVHILLSARIIIGTKLHRRPFFYHTLYFRTKLGTKKKTRSRVQFTSALERVGTYLLTARRVVRPAARQKRLVVDLIPSAVRTRPCRRAENNNKNVITAYTTPWPTRWLGNLLTPRRHTKRTQPVSSAVASLSDDARSSPPSATTSGPLDGLSNFARISRINHPDLARGVSKGFFFRFFLSFSFSRSPRRRTQHTSMTCTMCTIRVTDHSCYRVVDRVRRRPTWSIFARAQDIPRPCRPKDLRFVRRSRWHECICFGIFFSRHRRC